MAEMICLNDGFFSFAKMFRLSSFFFIVFRTSAAAATGLEIVSSAESRTDALFTAVL